MYRFTLFAVAVGLIVLLTTGFGAVAQNTDASQQAKSGDPQTKRLIYVVQQGSAKELADALTKHFKGDAEFEVVSAGGGNAILISAKSSVSDEVLQTLAKLDRKPQMVEIVIFLMEVAPKKGPDGKMEAGNIDEKDLSGPADGVIANIKSLQKKGVINTFCHLQWTAVEGKAVTLQDRHSKPYITGSVNTSGKDGKLRTNNTVAYRDVGTQVVLTPWMGIANAVTLDIQLKSSRAVPSTDGIALGKDENGEPILATEFPNAEYSGKLTLNSGQAVLAKGVQTTSKAGNLRTLVVVSAKVLP